VGVDVDFRICVCVCAYAEAARLKINDSLLERKRKCPRRKGSTSCFDSF